MRGRDDGKRLGAAELGGTSGSGPRWCSSPAPSASPAGPRGGCSPRWPAWSTACAHIEIDAEAHLDLVRELGILKTPTVLVLDADGRIVRRAAGLPRKADVIAALGEAV